jgi:hypothetical protein
MKMKSTHLLALLLAALWSTTTLTAGEFHDDFDDNLLDPAWEISLTGVATGWDYSEAGTNLSVTDIGVTHYTSSWNSDWANVNLSQAIDPMDDFHFYFDFSWGASDVQAMEGVELALLAADESVVAMCRYADYWVQYAAERQAEIAGDLLRADGLLPLSGAAATELVRTGEDIEIYWDGELLHTGTSAASIEQVRLTFAASNYVGSLGTSYFGDAAVDRVSTIPEPGTIVLWSIGALGVFIHCWRSRKRRPH